MAMMATAERSMPRPMMTMAMPSARMPSTETERTIATRLSGATKPGKRERGDDEDDDGRDEHDPFLIHHRQGFPAGFRHPPFSPARCRLREVLREQFAKA